MDVHSDLVHELDVRAESAKALVSGAMEMATATGYGPAVKDGQTYSLQPRAQDAWRTWLPQISPQPPPWASDRLNLPAKEGPAQLHQSRGRE